MEKMKKSSALDNILNAIENYPEPKWSALELDPEAPILPPDEAAGCVPCQGCNGFRLPYKACNSCGTGPTRELSLWVKKKK